MTSEAEKISAILTEDRCRTASGCQDLQSSVTVDGTAFPTTFMLGFAASAAPSGRVDARVLSYAARAGQVRNIRAATPYSTDAA